AVAVLGLRAGSRDGLAHPVKRATETARAARWLFAVCICRFHWLGGDAWGCSICYARRTTRVVGLLAVAVSGLHAGDGHGLAHPVKRAAKATSRGCGFVLVGFRWGFRRHCLRCDGCRRAKLHCCCRTCGLL